jgi:peptidylprolyl isomerase
VRRTPALLSALAATALLAAALTGCAPGATRGPGNQPAGCTPDFAAGDASSIVKASGKVGTQPKASFPTPLVTKRSQVTVLAAGHGVPAQKGSQIDFDYTVYNGATGESLGGSGYDASQMPRAAAGEKIPGQQGGAATTSTLLQSLVCAQAGSRLALTTTSKALGLGDLSQYGISATGTVVVVVDVHDVYLGKADGLNLLPQDGMPNVVTAVSGQPGIVLQELQKPTTARVETVKAGGGAVLEKGAKAILMFTAWTWPSGADKPVIVDALDTWTGNQAATVELTPLSKGGALPDKLVDALVGQKVGTQILAVLPPKDGFASSSLPSGVTAKDTLIFVVDIVGVQK